MNVDNIHYRTIWPAEDKKTIKIIDQRRLPHCFVIKELARPKDFEVAIRGMHVRGAGLIGATAGFGMYSAARAAQPDNFDRDVRVAADRLIATRPTAANLAWSVQRQLAAMAGQAGPADKINTAFATACAIADQDAEFCRKIGEHGLEIIKEISGRKNGAPVNILTHCNAGWLAFVDYGSATAPIYAAHRQGIPIHVWVDETRPWNQGARLTAWELGQERVPHTLIVDNCGGHLMQHGQVDLVLVGSDRTTRTGDVANKIGTYLKALAARDCGVPFYVALPPSTFDWTIRHGLSEIPIEERSGDEVRYVSGLDRERNPATVLICPPDTRAANYGFDVTPARLITGLISDRGVMAADEEAILALYPEYR